MRRHILASTGAVLLTGALLAGCGNNAEEPDVAVGGASADDNSALPAARAGQISPEAAADLMTMRSATAGYVTDVNAAMEAGYQPMTQQVDGVGVQYLNSGTPDGYDPNQPQLLVYPSEGSPLAAVGWTFTSPPEQPPLEGAQFVQFPAACHYDDGSYMEQTDEGACEEVSPESDAGLTYWHPELTIMYVWAWMPNPDGVFASTNPLLSGYGGPEASPTATATPGATPEYPPTESPPPTGYETPTEE